MASSITPPNPRVVLTAYNADGKSIIGSDFTSEPQDLGTGTTFACYHLAEKVPMDSVEVLRKTEEEGPGMPRAPPKGVIFGNIDFPPGAHTPMHRTLSMDYGIIKDGEIYLSLDGGDETLLSAGDVVVQRGTTHSWINRGQKVCRMAFVAIGREEVTLNTGEKV